MEGRKEKEIDLFEEVGFLGTRRREGTNSESFFKKGIFFFSHCFFRFSRSSLTNLLRREEKSRISEQDKLVIFR